MEPKTAVHEDKITKSLGQWIRRDKTIHPSTYQSIITSREDIKLYSKRGSVGTCVDVKDIETLRKGYYENQPANCSDN